MTRAEFLSVMLYLESATTTANERSLSAARIAARNEVYFDLLGDLPLSALKAAAQAALAESQYPVFPPVGVLRRLATEGIGANQLSAAEAWELVRKAISLYGFYQQRAGLKSLPEVVRRAADALGWEYLCNATETGVAFAQFRGAYETLAERERRQEALPAKVSRALLGVGTMPQELRIANISKEDRP